MKKILILAIAIFMSVAGKSQTATNNTACNVSVTPLCYNTNTYGINCAAPVAVPFSISVPGSSTMVAIPNCNNPRVSVGYEVCWDNGSCGRTCVILDAGASALYPACHTSAGGFFGAPWAWVATTTATLPACGTCSPSVTVSINTATDHIEIN